MPDTTLDDETTAALTLFNEYVVADRERTQREKRIKKAERAKDEAAAAVKKLGEKGSAEDKAAAEKAYREATDTWKALRDGKEPPKAEDAPADEPEATTDEAPADEPEATTDEAPADEPEATTDEAPADEPEATTDEAVAEEQS